MEAGRGTEFDAIIAPGDEALSLGTQILTAEDFAAATAGATGKEAEGSVVTKIEVEKVPVSVGRFTLGKIKTLNWPEFQFHHTHQSISGGGRGGENRAVL